jgi:uncharacterized membrane protein HdeD (DUF308 family)
MSGLIELFLAFTLPRSAAMRVMLFISGAPSLVLAVLAFRHFGDTYAVLLLSMTATGRLDSGQNAVACHPVVDAAHGHGQ